MATKKTTRKRNPLISTHVPGKGRMYTYEIAGKRPTRDVVTPFGTRKETVWFPTAAARDEARARAMAARKTNGKRKANGAKAQFLIGLSDATGRPYKAVMHAWAHRRRELGKRALELEKMGYAGGATAVRELAAAKKNPAAGSTKVPAGTKRKRNASKVPRKVLKGHAAIWGGKIPPGALAQLEKEYARDAFKKATRKRNPMDAATRNWIRGLVASYGGDREKTAKWISRLPGLRMGIAAARSAVAEAMRTSNPAKKKTAAKRKRNGSDLGAAAKMYRKFHGENPSSVREVKQLRVTPSALADCGRLVELVVDTGRGGRKLPFPKSAGVRVATTGDGGQLYFVGGDQRLDLNEWSGLALPKDHVQLGYVVTIAYHTSKDFHNFEPSVYEHEFGETGKARPALCYDVHSSRLYLVGGGYQVKRPGIVD